MFQNFTDQINMQTLWLSIGLILDITLILFIAYKYRNVEGDQKGVKSGYLDIPWAWRGDPYQYFFINNIVFETPDVANRQGFFYAYYKAKTPHRHCIFEGL